MRVYTVLLISSRLIGSTISLFFVACCRPLLLSFYLFLSYMFELSKWRNGEYVGLTYSSENRIRRIRMVGPWCKPLLVVAQSGKNALLSRANDVPLHLLSLCHHNAYVLERSISVAEKVT